MAEQTHTPDRGVSKPVHTTLTFPRAGSRGKRRMTNMLATPRNALAVQRLRLYITPRDECFA